MYIYIYIYIYIYVCVCVCVCVYWAFSMFLVKLSHREKIRSSRYSAETMTDSDSTDDQTLLPNTPAQGKYLGPCLSHVTEGISLHLSAN